jgi:flagellar biosynthesis protein FlhG
MSGRRHAGEDQAAALRARLPAGAHGPRPPVIALASGKGGVGKTLLSVSLAASLARQRRVVLVDADLGAANADIMLGVAPLRRLDECFLTGFAPGRRPVDLAVEVGPGLCLVPGIVGGHCPTDRGQRRALLASLGDFSGRADTVVLDLPAGIDESVVDLLMGADCPVIVVTPEPTSVADAYALLKTLHAAWGEGGAARVQVLVNMAQDGPSGEGVYRRIAAVSERFLGVRPLLAGVVRQEAGLAAGVRRQRPAVTAGAGGAPGRVIAAVAHGLAVAATMAQDLRSDPPEASAWQAPRPSRPMSGLRYRWHRLCGWRRGAVR